MKKLVIVFTIMLMLLAPCAAKSITRRSMMGMPCNSISGLGCFTPSCASLDPSPAAIIANFILWGNLFLVVVGQLQVQAVAVIALLEVELA